MSLTNYLNQYFVEKQKFAELAGVLPERLDQLINVGAIPCATYKSDGVSIEMPVFGRIDGYESLPGEYFRPECARWVKIADQAPQGLERSAVLDVLITELTSALATYGYPLSSLQAKVQEYIPYFFDGTFGLCVANPSTGAGIARKGELQERLIEITNDGSNSAPNGITREELLQLIDDYADAAMPFSPAEYAQSSRKRLVDDLRQKIEC